MTFSTRFEPGLIDCRMALKACLRRLARLSSSHEEPVRALHLFL